MVTPLVVIMHPVGNVHLGEILTFRLMRDFSVV